MVLTFHNTGEAVISNTGVILAAGEAINGIGNLGLKNLGDIVGDIEVMGASVILNSGRILADVRLGAGNDRVSVTGLVEGSIALGDGTNEFVLLGGQVTGTVCGGVGWDSYTVDQANVQIIDHGGT